MKRTSGFTLMEVLVSITILLVIMAFMTDMLSGVRLVSDASKKHLNADDEARGALDRIEGDLKRIVTQSSVDFLLNKNANDSFYFYSEAPTRATAAAGISQPVGLIGYRINSSYQLERLGMGLVFSGQSNNVVFLTYTNYPVTTSSVPLAASTFSGAYSNQVSASSSDINFQVLAPDVFRLQVSFLLQGWMNSNGALQPPVFSTIPYNTNASYTNMVSRSDSGGVFSAMRIAGIYSNWSEIGLSDVKAIIITIALLDPISQQMAGSSGGTSGIQTSQFASMVAGLSPSAGDSTDLQASPPILAPVAWRAAILSGTFEQTASLPHQIANQVRIYQRVIPLR